MLNPSPFMFYLEGGDTTLVGASPELLVRLEGSLEIRPITGTRRRGLTDAEDQALAGRVAGEREGAGGST